jgi:hypothetical protein
MGYRIICVICILTLTIGFRHPIHVSVTNIECVEDGLVVTTKIFMDDFEEIILRKYGEKVNLVENKDGLAERTNIDNYLKENLKIYLSGRNLFDNSVNLDSTKISEYAIWLNYKVNNIRKIKKLTIVNTIFNDMYEDQTNLVIFNCNDYSEGLKFDIDNTKKEIVI